MSGKFKMGQEVKDVVTGFRGFVTAQLVYMTGCVQYQVEIAKGTELKAYWLDEDRLELIKPKKKRERGRPAKPTYRHGGPSRGPSPY